MSLDLHQLRLSWQDSAGKSYLLDDFSLSIAAGEIALIQGPSGCGKSTLLSAIAGTAPPELQLSGTISLNGKRIDQIPPERRHIGILFQDALLFPHLSVAENLAFGLPQHLSRAARKQAVTTALGQAGLPDYGERDPAHLSGGQKARIAMMRAMLSAPQALLMDESFAALDPSLRARFGQFVAERIEAQNIPALLISHHEDDKAFATGQIIQWPN